VDVGGTFTDLIVADETGVRNLVKVPTTPHDPTIGVLDAVRLAADETGRSTDQLLRECELFLHGTTVSTNALLQKKTAKTGLLCTKGHRHILYYRDAGKLEPYNLRVKYPEPLIPIYLTLPVTERVNSEGGIETPLDEHDAREAIRQLKAWNVEAIAVALLWSIVNPAHEQRIAEIIDEQWPGVHTSISSEVQPLVREYHRTCATVIDASVKPIIREYVESLQKSLAENGLAHEFLMVASSGGVMSATDSLKRPIYTVNSGPSMGPLSGKVCGETIGSRNVIVMDMGGTSFEVSTVIDGVIPVSRDQKIGADPLGIIAVDVNTLGAGGGSVAWVDPGGMLCVGPQSAGADPGPACYAMGGKDATVTDADVLLGYLNPDNFLGGRMKLDRHLAHEAIDENIAKPLKLSVEEAAAAIVRVVEEKMFSGIEEITVRRGIDPREFLLVSGGGAGAAHAIALAEELGIQRILIPKHATALCAYGMLASDVRFDNAITYYTDSKTFDFEAVNNNLTRLETLGRESLLEGGIAPEKIRFEYFVEARYPFQVWGLEYPLPGERITGEMLPQIVDDFERMHEERYGAREPGQYVEFTHWRVTASGLMPKVPATEQKSSAGEDASKALKGTRKAYFKEVGAFVDASIYDGRILSAGNTLEGPVIVEEPATTLVIPPKWKASVTPGGDYILERSSDPQTL
jgi:N-methylhydantoinase A